MRKIGDFFDKTQTVRLSYFLISKGIENQMTVEEGGSYGLWILSEDQMPQAENWIKVFLKNPEDPQWEREAERGKKLKETQAKQNQQVQYIDVRTHWHRYEARGGPLTLALILISVAIAVITRLGSDPRWVVPLSITDYQIVGNYIQWPSGLPEILHGQIWRLWTPLFIHLGILHLLFNMLWLKDLGTLVERHQGKLILALLVLIIGALSNVSQYLVSGPNFGGMSGVIYGLLGYIWIRGRYDPASGFSLNPSVVTTMIVWFFICLFGLVGNVANMAHGSGLVLGMAWGFLSAKFRR